MRFFRKKTQDDVADLIDKALALQGDGKSLSITKYGDQYLVNGSRSCTAAFTRTSIRAALESEVESLKLDFAHSDEAKALRKKHQDEWRAAQAAADERFIKEFESRRQKPC